MLNSGRLVPIDIINKPIKKLIMGCGCKNKNQGQATQQTVQTQQSSASQVVQNAIKKTVEKYYEKK